MNHTLERQIALACLVMSSFGIALGISFIGRFKTKKEKWITLSICAIIALIGGVYLWFNPAQPGEPIPYQQLQNPAVETSAGWKDVTEPEADALFRDPSYYSMPALQSHEALWGPEMLLLRFRFGEGAKPEELTNARGFMLSRFVLWKASNFGGTPYDEFVKKQEQAKTTVCEVYLGDALILQEQYQRTRPLSSYENMDILYAPRVVEDETTQALTAVVQK